MPLPHFFRKAERLILHPEELLSTLTSALTKAYAKRSVLFKVFEDFLMLFRLVRHWVKGEYPNVPKRTIVWAVIAILYFLSPFDLLPDILPGGYIDDIAFISYVVKKIQEDLTKFAQWEAQEKNQQKKMPVPPKAP